MVVDNASTDGSADELDERFPGVRVIRLDENVGFAAANNLVAGEAAECEWLALLNPDAFPEAGWLEELLAAAAQKPGYSFFASRLVMAADPDRLDAAGDVLHVSGVAWPRDRGDPRRRRRRTRREVFSASAAAALYRRDAFLDRGRIRRALLLLLRGRRSGLPPAPGRSPLLVRADRGGKARRPGDFGPRQRLLPLPTHTAT